MGYQQINFDDLAEQYRDHGPAVTAVELLREARAGQTRPKLAYLLRHHDEATVNDAETYQRDSFDLLLAYYSLLEIGCLIRYVPRTFPEAFRKESLWILSHAAVKRYYEQNYPILLPRLFYLRLKGSLSLYERDKHKATHPLFHRFLGIVNREREDGEIELFQWFLDGGSRGGHDIGATLKLLESPHKTMKALMKDPTKRTIAEQSVSGAQKFFTFCGEFDGLLQEARPFPLFQSAMWSYYAYWFELIGETVGRRLGQILESLLGWGPEDSEADLKQQRQQIERQVTTFWDSFDQRAAIGKVKKRLGRLRKTVDEPGLKPDKQAIRKHVATLKSLLERLLSQAYGQTLRDAVAKRKKRTR